MQPIFTHRRSDLYSLIFKENSQISENQKFAEHTIPKETIFYKTGLSYAFVNLKPVVSGHVLVSPLRLVEKFKDLSDQETADLFITVQKVAKMLEEHYKLTSSNITLQDGEDAGQTVKHVHVHITPRRKDDFMGQPDKIYKELQGSEDHREARSLESMIAEAAIYKELM